MSGLVEGVTGALGALGGPTQYSGDPYGDNPDMSPAGQNGELIPNDELRLPDTSDFTSHLDSHEVYALQNLKTEDSNNQPSLDDIVQSMNRDGMTFGQWGANKLVDAMLQKSADLANQTSNMSPDEFNRTMARMRELQSNMPTREKPTYNPINVALSVLAMAQSPNHAAETAAAAIQGPQNIATAHYQQALQNRAFDLSTMEKMAGLQLQAYNDKLNAVGGAGRTLATIAGELQRSQDAKYRSMAPLVWHMQNDYRLAPSQAKADNINAFMVKMGGQAIITPDQVAQDIQAHSDAMKAGAVKDLLKRGMDAGRLYGEVTPEQNAQFKADVAAQYHLNVSDLPDLPMGETLRKQHYDASMQLLNQKFNYQKDRNAVLDDMAKHRLAISQANLGVAMQHLQLAKTAAEQLTADREYRYARDHYESTLNDPLMKATTKLQAAQGALTSLQSKKLRPNDPMLLKAQQAVDEHSAEVLYLQGELGAIKPPPSPQLAQQPQMAAPQIAPLDPGIHGPIGGKGWSITLHK